jgi:hypothetical protein
MGSVSPSRCGPGNRWSLRSLSNDESFAANLTTLELKAWSSDDPLQVNRVVVGNDQLLHLALLPTGGNSVPHLSTVSTDYVEVILEYRIQAADEALCQ